jgi:hypothetical protein
MRYAARELKGGEVGESMERVSWPPCSWMPAMILETSASWAHVSTELQNEFQFNLGVELKSS